MSDFVHLHVHSEYSLLDGACRIEELVPRIQALGMDAVAVTDHGVMGGVVALYQACQKAGVHSVLGCECYVAPRSRFDRVYGVDNKPYHLVLLAENRTGYENLMVLSTEGYLSGFYSKPRIDKELLRAHHEGLIGLSACLAGELARDLTAGQYERAKEAALEYADIFGPEHFYIELQNHKLPEQEEIIPELLRLCKETGLPPVITNDAHYISSENAEAQHILMCIQTNHTLHEEGGMAFDTNEFYIKSPEEMRAAFANYSDPLIDAAMKNTGRIAARCQVDFTFDELKLPKFTPEGGESDEELFDRLCKEGLAWRYAGQPAQEVLDRMRYETGVIRQMGFLDYYLIVWDFIHFAKTHDIPVGPGRGSGAGSLVAYLLGITDVDPLRYGLLFERFLNPERVTMPDFDIDFCFEGRQRVIDYVIEKYGADRVSQIITFGTMAARGVIRDVGRVLGMPYAIPDKIARMIPQELGMTISKALLVNGELKKQYDSNPEIRQLIDTAQTLEGMPRNASTHAAGVVITPEAVVRYLPQQKNDNAVVTQYAKETVEELGLLKIDFLGLRTLTVIDQATKAIKKNHAGARVAFGAMDDPAVYQMLSAGRSNCVFQLESGGMKQLLMQLKPKNLEDLVAAISLYRPGPMKNIPVYLANRREPDKTVYLHERLRPILESTCGIAIYQEQVMQICRSLAGFSYGRSDLVRRAMAKKKAAVMENERAAFLYGCPAKDGKPAVPGCEKNGIPPEIANKIYDEMSSFAAYAFNKSHAVGYATLAYRTAWLKCHYPSEFMAAMLTVYLEDMNKVIEYIAECRRMKLPVLPPDVNQSDIGFTATKEGIRFGLLAIKNIGRGSLERILKERQENGPFTDFLSFCNRTGRCELNVRGLESLISAGALDHLGWNRCQMMSSAEGILSSLSVERRRQSDGQLSLFERTEEKETVFAPPELPEYEPSKLLRMEKEVTGLFLSGHPLSSYEQLAARCQVDSVRALHEMKDETPVALLGLIVSVQNKTTRGGAHMAVLQLEDFDARIEVLVFPRVLEQNIGLLREGSVLFCRGKLSAQEDEEPKVLASAFCTPENNPVDFCRRLRTVGGEQPAKAEKKSEVRAAARTAERQKGRLCIKLTANEQFALVRPILEAAPGNIPVLFYLAVEKAYRAAPKELNVTVSAALLAALDQVPGIETVFQKAKE